MWPDNVVQVMGLPTVPKTVARYCQAQLFYFRFFDMFFSVSLSAVTQQKRCLVPHVERYRLIMHRPIGAYRPISANDAPDSLLVSVPQSIKTVSAM